MNPGEKRALKAKQSEGKRPRSLPSGVLEELQNDRLYGIAIGLEPLIRRVVTEEIERALSKWPVQVRVPLQQQIIGSSAKKFRLEFKTNPAAMNFTEDDLEAEHVDTICVMLVDAVTGQPVTTGPESAATLDVVPLLGDFKTSEEHEWSTEEFERNVAKERAGKGPLLVGDLKVKLENGVGTLGQMYFTDNSSSTRCKKFRLGVRVAQDNEHGLMSIQEGKSKAFAVRDKRGKAYMKHDTPSPTDEVWRLRNIRRGGPFHTKLEQNGIHTVQDLLSRLQTRPADLKDVLCNMLEKAYQDTIDHAKKCRFGDKLYIYQVEWPPYESLIFSPHYQLMGAVMQGHYVSLEMVPDTEKVHLDGLMKCAYDHWETDVTEWDPAELIATAGTVDGSLPHHAKVDAAATFQGALNVFSGAERVPASWELIPEPGYVEENAMEQWASQGQSSGFGMESLSEDLRRQTEGLRRSITEEEVASQVQYIIGQESGDHVGLLSIEDPGPAGGRLWLRIRSVIRCALFMRRAGLAQSFSNK